MISKLIAVTFLTGLFGAVAAFAAPPTGAPAGATGLCKDGSYWSGPTKSGACQGHKGLKDWYAVAAKPTTATSGVPAATPKPASSAIASSVPKTPTATAGAGAPPAMAKTGAPSGQTAPANPALASKAAVIAPAATTLSKPASPSAMATTSAVVPKAAVTTPPGAASGKTLASPAASASVPPAPAPAPAPATKLTTAAAGAEKVWVNDKVYHCSSSKWYGKTKTGSYMTEQAAMAAGAHPDHGKACH
jgi:hypothetical protein